MMAGTGLNRPYRSGSAPVRPCGFFVPEFRHALCCLSS